MADIDAAPHPIRPRWLATAAGGTAVAIAAAALVVVFTRQPASAAGGTQCGGGVPHLTVRGVGSASGRPDSLQFQAQVSVTAASAQSALAEDNQTTASVVAAVEAAGVRAKDVETTDLTINPTYAYVHGQSVITGYGVTDSISVTVTKLTAAGAVIDATTGAGGNAVSVDSLAFARTDPRRLENRARSDAVHQAVTHAAAMARAAGQRLGAVCSLTDQSGLSPSPTPLQLGAQSAAAGASSVPLEGGTQQASAQVTLVYGLAPLGR
ncbi:MAG: SIMPL domain-containing protein [Acidimicrobiales bacterium]